jgi:hypothetical protein
MVGFDGIIFDTTSGILAECPKVGEVHFVDGETVLMRRDDSYTPFDEVRMDSVQVFLVGAFSRDDIGDSGQNDFP